MSKHLIIQPKQESLFSKAYCPLTQQYFSAGLVWSLPCWGGGGSSSTTTSGGGDPLPPPLLGGGVLFHHHLQWWGPLPPPLWGGLFHYHFWRVLFHHHFLGGGSSSTTTSRGVPCDLSHNAPIYRYRTPHCIIGKIHMGPPPPR